jgi:hypothetical protein
MLDLKINTPAIFQKLSDQSPMTVMWFRLAAQQTSIFEEHRVKPFIDTSSIHEVEKSLFVLGPASLSLLVAVQDVLRGCEDWFVHVFGADDLANKVG